MNDEIYKLLESFFKPLLNYINIRSEDFDFRYFSEFINELRTVIAKQFSEVVNNKEILQSVIDFIKSININDVLRELKDYNDKKINELKKSDPRIEKFFYLLEEVDKIIPNMSFIILTRIKPLEHLRKMIEPCDLFEEVEGSRGEHKARIVMRLFRDVCEYQYDNYIRILWEITSVLEYKKEINTTGTFGQLVDGLIDRLGKFDSLELIEPDAGWIRNAATHASYTYNLTNNNVIAWDRNRPAKEIETDNLLGTAQRMYSIASKSLFEIYIAHIYRVIFTNDLIEFLNARKNDLINFESSSYEELKRIIITKFEPISANYNFIRDSSNTLTITLEK